MDLKIWISPVTPIFILESISWTVAEFPFEFMLTTWINTWQGECEWIHGKGNVNEYMAGGSLQSGFSESVHGHVTEG
jgi:hypothetical protein